MSSILDSVLTFTDGPAPAPQAKRPTEDLPRVREVPQTCSCGRSLKDGFDRCARCLTPATRHRPELGDCHCGRPKPCFQRRCLRAE